MADDFLADNAARAVPVGRSLVWIGAGTLLAASALSWFWSRRQEPALEERTRDRLAPRRRVIPSAADIEIRG